VDTVDGRPSTVTLASAQTALALPLNLEINRPPCTRWETGTSTYGADTVPAEPRTALATAYTTGGPRCLVRAVQQLTGVPVTGFLAPELTSVKAAVDTLGGITVCGTPLDGDQAAAQPSPQTLAALVGTALAPTTLLSPGTSRAVGRELRVLADHASPADLRQAREAVELPVSAAPNTRGNLELRTAEATRLFAALRADEPSIHPRFTSC
jgi:hypothetical protein